MEGGGGAKKREIIEEQASARGRGEKERGRKKRGGGKVADILARDHNSSTGHQSALLLYVPAKISTGT